MKINPNRRSIVLSAPALIAAGSGLLPAQASAQRVGQPLLLFPAPKLDGEMFDPKTIDGHVVLLYVWASWCPYCLRDIAPLRDKQEQYKDKKFSIVGVNLDQNPGDAEKWMKTYKANFISVRPTADYKNAYGNNGRISTPSWWLANHEGKVVDSSTNDGAQFVYRGRIETIDKLVAKAI